ncbi:MAG: leucine-rich repeat domain-containing protein, partial [Lachnospiraceae bacterium]|nr:leucine-rich repeat domain-containing protein [Lachnospiraceae bacterium]
QKVTALKKGTKKTVGAGKYQVTKSSTTNGTVAYLGAKTKTRTSATIPSSVTISGVKYKVTTIANNAFKNNKKLKKVTIPVNITKIGSNAFYGCSKLKTITVKSTTLKSVGKNALKGIYKKAKIKVPSKKLSAYKKLFKNKGQKSTVKITK